MKSINNIKFANRVFWQTIKKISSNDPDANSLWYLFHKAEQNKIISTLSRYRNKYRTSHTVNYGGVIYELNYTDQIDKFTLSLKAKEKKYSRFITLHSMSFSHKTKNN